MIISEKQLMANCLDALQEASDYLVDIIEENYEANEWYEEIQSIYGAILKEYER